MRKTSYGICIIGQGVRPLTCPIFDNVKEGDFICQANKHNTNMCRDCKDNQHRQRGTIVRANKTLVSIVKV